MYDLAKELGDNAAVSRIDAVRLALAQYLITFKAEHGTRTVFAVDVGRLKQVCKALLSHCCNNIRLILLWPVRMTLQLQLDATRMAHCRNVCVFRVRSAASQEPRHHNARDHLQQLSL